MTTFTKAERKEMTKGLFVAFIGRSKFDEVQDNIIRNAITCLEKGTGFESKDHYQEVLSKVKKYLEIK